MRDEGERKREKEHERERERGVEEKEIVLNLFYSPLKMERTIGPQPLLIRRRRCIQRLEEKRNVRKRTSEREREMEWMGQGKK